MEANVENLLSNYGWWLLALVLIAAGVAFTLPNFYLLPTGRFVPRVTLLLALI